MNRFLTLCLTALMSLTTWAADTEVYDFKGLNTTADVNRGESLGFTVNNGSNRTIYSFSIANVELDCSRLGGFIGGATDGNFSLKPAGLLLKGRILSILDLKNGDKVTIDYQLASGGTVTLADATLIGNTTDNTFVSGTEYTISTNEESVHLDIISSANNNYIEKVTVTPYEAPSPGPEPSGDAVSVFLTAGQSNTAGRCMNDNLPDYIKTLGTNNNGAYQYCNWSYTNGTTRKNESEGVFRKFWPEMESSSNNGRFAYDAIVYYWIEQALQKDFYVVKHAQGGTSIDPSCSSTNDYHWSADATWLAEHASCNTEGGTSMLKAFCDNIGASLDALTTNGKTYDIKALIWHQGESDRSGTGPDGYHDNLKAVVKYVRDYLVTKTGDEKYATLDFICGTVPTNSKQYNKKVYDALFALASEDSHFHVIETSPGTFIGDQLHFDTNCAERLGIGMYNKMVDLGLVSGEKQTVPEVIIPEGQPVTLNFQQWAIDNIGTDKSVQKALTLSSESIAATGDTQVYKVTGCEAEGDFSEFAETFALSADEVKMRGNVGLQLNSNKVVTFSILNLNPGDGVTITFGAGSTGVTTLAALSENLFVYGDDNQTVLEAGTALTSKTVTYVVKEGTQVDLTFGSTGGHYINSIVIEPGKVDMGGDEPVVPPTEDPTTAVTIHTIGDSTMSHYDQSIAAQKGMYGWGDFLADCMKSDWTTVKNWADRGETAKSYYNGYWNGTKPDERPDFTQEINKEVSAGDYVIIQFGHNDSKAYTTAEYEEWLGTLVDAVKAKGATPIIASSICRARFDSNGKITRLGRIDTGEENGVGEDDHTYDYPYHAQLVATAKGVEFIDVTTGVKDMFETYGEAKTKALFPSGEKTHTNELGAQLIAKVAASLLQNTAISGYVDGTKLELPAVDEIEVVIDDFGTEEVVTKRTVWTFDSQTENVEAVTPYNNMYLRGDAGSSAIQFNELAYNGAFPDETPVSISKVAYSPGGITVANIGTSTAGKATGNKKTFAFNIGKPGKFYAIAASNSNNTERSIKLVFSGEVKDEIPFDKNVGVLEYSATTTGVVYLCAEGSFNLYAAMFVPDMEPGTEEDWNYQMVQTRADGYWTYCNRMADNQKVPEGLTAYAVSAIDANGKAVLSNVGSVITPGMGVIVKGAANTEYPMASTADAATYAGENLLVGNTTLQYLPATTGELTNFYFENGTTGFAKATGGETIHEKQAYLSVASTAETIAMDMADEEPMDVDIDDVMIDTKTTWTFADYISQNFKVYNHNGLFLHGGKVLGADDSRMAATSGTFKDTEEAWETTKALLSTQGADFSEIGNITAAANEGPAGSVAFNNSVPGMLYVVYGAATATDGTFTISQRAEQATTFSTIYEETMEGCDYSGPLGTPHRAASPFTEQSLAVELTDAGTVYLGGSQPYCIYAMLFVPKAIETPAISWKENTADGKAVYTITSADDSNIKYQIEGQEVVDTQAKSADVTVESKTTLTFWAYQGNAKSDDTQTTLLTTPIVESDYAFDFSKVKNAMEANVSVTLEETADVTIGETSYYMPTLETAATFAGKIGFSALQAAGNVYLRNDKGLLAVKAGQSTLGVVLKGVAAGKSLTITIDGTAPATATTVTGTLTFGQPYEVEADDLTEGNFVVTFVNFTGTLNIKSIAVGDLKLTAPTITLKGLTQDKTKSVYTITYNHKDVLHYKFGTDGEEQTPVVATPGSYDIEITASNTLIAWTTREGAIASDETQTDVYAPTQAIEENGVYNFKGMTLGVDYNPITLTTDATVIGETTVYAPDALTANTFNEKFAFSSDYNWKFRQNYGIHIDKNKEGYMAILGLKKDDVIRIVVAGVTTTVNMTTTVIADAEIVSGTTYTVAQDGDLLLKVGSTTGGLNTYIEKICVNEQETVSEPSLTLKVSEDVSTQVTIRPGVSSLDKTVTTYYTTDGTEPTTESTSISKATNVTMKQSCTIKAVTISESGVRSNIATLSVSVSDGVIAAVDYTDSDIALAGDRSDINILKNIPVEVLIYLPATSAVTGTNVIIKQANDSYVCQDFQLNDGKVSSIPHPFTATSAKMNRVFVGGKKCTVCLPYDFDADGGTFYKFTGVVNNKVQMTQQTGTLSGNTPYIFVPDEGTNAITAENVEVSTSDAPQTVNDEAHFTFIGTYEPITWQSPVGIYGFAAEDNGIASVGQFVRVGSGASIAAYRAYLQYTGEGVIHDVQSVARRVQTNLPRTMAIEWIAADVTGIRNLTPALSKGDGAIYNLSGQAVGKDYKGIVIVNGKKVRR